MEWRGTERALGADVLFSRSLLPVLAALGALAALSLSACRSESAPTGSQDDEIRGGAVETGYPAVGIVRMENGSFCTGTLVAPDVVLTAGHCLRETAVSFHLGAGRPVTDFHSTEAIDTMTKHPVAGQAAYPGFLGRRDPECPSPMLDVALVKLAEPVPTAEAAPDPIDDRVPEASEACVTVGFGEYEGTFHQKRSATEKMRQERATAFGLDAFRVSTKGGDSGGPLYCRGAVVAVNSCGDAPDWFARLDAARPWLDALLADWDPEAAEAIVTGATEDGGTSEDAAGIKDGAPGPER